MSQVILDVEIHNSGSLPAAGKVRAEIPDDLYIFFWVGPNCVKFIQSQLVELAALCNAHSSSLSKSTSATPPPLQQSPTTSKTISPATSKSSQSCLGELRELRQTPGHLEQPGDHQAS
jgi:hypothetical protein